VTWRDPSRDDGVLIRGVPALVCDFCGNEQFTAAVARELDRIADERPVPAWVVEVPVYEFAPVPAEAPVA
jgi:YgiT-type zinc finger domain-containing protein